MLKNALRKFDFTSRERREKFDGGRKSWEGSYESLENANLWSKNVIENPLRETFPTELFVIETHRFRESSSIIAAVGGITVQTGA